MTKTELQAQILNNTKSRNELASAIHKLPESETRGEVIHKHDKISERLNELHNNLERIDKDTCHFGFSDFCSGMVCANCPDFKQEKIYGR